MRKPNYRFERAERDRLKQAKKGDAPFWSGVNAPQREPPA